MLRNQKSILWMKKRNFFKEKICFLEFEHNSLLDRNNVLTQEIENVKTFLSKNENFPSETSMLNEILDNCKSHGDKRGLGYINKSETPTSGKTLFVKGKEENSNQTTSTKIESPKKEALTKIGPVCSHCNKSGHTQFRCHTRLLERYKSYLNRVMHEFNSLKNNILNIGKGNKTQQSNFKKTPKIKQIWVKKESPKSQVMTRAPSDSKSSPLCNMVESNTSNEPLDSLKSKFLRKSLGVCLTE